MDGPSAGSGPGPSTDTAPTISELPPADRDFDEFGAAMAPLLTAMANAEPIPRRDWERRRRRIEGAFSRLARNLTIPPDVSTTETTMSNGSVLRIYESGRRPPEATLVYAHGGGRFACSVDTYDPVLRCYAALGVRVVAVDYRLPPETPLPSAIEDIAAATVWSREHIAPGERIVLGGDSGGGGLAVSAALELRAAAGIQPDGVMLIYPMLDDRTGTVPSTGHEHLLWTVDDNECAWQVSTPNPHLPNVVPARVGDLAALPRFYLEVGTADLFAQEIRSFSDQLAAAHNEPILRIVHKAPHAYDLVAPDAPSTRASWRARQRFLLTAT